MTTHQKDIFFLNSFSGTEEAPRSHWLGETAAELSLSRQEPRSGSRTNPDRPERGTWSGDSPFKCRIGCAVRSCQYGSNTDYYFIAVCFSYCELRESSSEGLDKSLQSYWWVDTRAETLEFFFAPVISVKIAELHLRLHYFFYFMLLVKECWEYATLIQILFFKRCNVDKMHAVPV